MFPENNTFSKTIFDFLVWVPVILLSDQGASMKLWEIQRENWKFFLENALLSEYTDFIAVPWLFSTIESQQWKLWVLHHPWRNFFRIEGKIPMKQIFRGSFENADKWKFHQWDPRESRTWCHSHAFECLMFLGFCR